MIRAKTFLFFWLVMFMLPACLSMQNQTTLDLIQEAVVSQPYVEAFIEYAGPNEQWAGPATFTIHVMTQEGGVAQIATKPDILSGGPIHKGITVKGRVLATSKKPVVTSEMAREQLASIAISLKASEGEFNGCMWPVRVRLVRADGSLIEKSGCRGQAGWSAVVSEAVNNLLGAAVYGS